MNRQLVAPAGPWLTCAYRNSAHSTSPQNLWGYLSVFFVSASLRDHLSRISGVPMVTAVGAAGSPGSKIAVQQTMCGLSLEQPPDGENEIRYKIIQEWTRLYNLQMRGNWEREKGCDRRNSHELPVEVRGDEEGRGGEEEEEEPYPLSLDYVRWMYHLSHHLRKTEAKIWWCSITVVHNSSPLSTPPVLFQIC